MIRSEQSSTMSSSSQTLSISFQLTVRYFLILFSNSAFSSSVLLVSGSSIVPSKLSKLTFFLPSILAWTIFYSFTSLIMVNFLSSSSKLTLVKETLIALSLSAFKFLVSNFYNYISTSSSGLIASLFSTFFYFFIFSYEFDFFDFLFLLSLA